MVEKIDSLRDKMTDQPRFCHSIRFFRWSDKMNRNSWLTIVILAALPFFGSWSAKAQVPRGFTYQGFLEENGAPVSNGNVTLNISIVDQANNQLFTEALPNVVVTAGIFNVVIGGTLPFPSTMDFNSQYSMQVEVTTSSGSTTLPPVVLYAVPYAINSNTVNGLQASSSPVAGELFPVPIGTGYTGSAKIDPAFLPSGIPNSLLDTADITTINGISPNASGNFKINAGNGITIVPGTNEITIGTSAQATSVTSVTNSDGTITTSPTTGNVVASLALGHANTWTATQTLPATNAQGSALANSINNATTTLINGSKISGNIPGNAANVTGTVPVSNGGTGITTVPAHSVLIGEGTNALATSAPSNAGYVLTSNGPSTDPSWQLVNQGVTSVSNVGSDGSLSISPTTGNVEASIDLSHANNWLATQTFPTTDAQGSALANAINNATTTLINGSKISGNIPGNAANVTGTIDVAHGGTGQTSYTNGQLLIGNTTGNTLTPGTLTQGSGISITNGNGSITIATTGAPPTGAAGGDLTGTYPNPTLATTGVTAASYGSATQVPTLTVDAKGRITSASNTTITGVTPGGNAGGDLTGTYPNPTLTTTGVTASSYGSATQVPTLTVDAKGRKTSASNTTIIGVTPGGNAGGDLTGTYPNPTLTTTGVTAASYGSATQVPTLTVDAKGRITSASNTTITGVTPGGVAGGDLTGTYPNPTIATTAGGDIITALTSNGGTLTNSTSGNAATVTTDANLTGPITSSGNATTITNGAVTYPKLQDESGSTLLGNPSGTSAIPGEIALGIGLAFSSNTLTVTGAPPTGAAGGDLTGTYPNPTLTTTGVSAASYGSTTQVPVLTVDAKGRITSASNTTITGVTPGGAAGGDLTGTYPNPTLVTTGVLAASYGSATQVPVLTVDAKGRITSASNTTITGVTPGGAAGGDLTGTYPNPTLTTTGVSAASYGSATQVPVLTVDAKGRITSATNTTITGVTPGGATGGDLTGTYPNPTLTTTGVTASSYGSATQVPVLTVDAKGRITSASNTTITGVTPGGTAGGDLAGTYPNPTIGAGVVTYAKLQNETNNTLLGNTSGAAAAPEELTIGSGLTVTGTTLSVAGALPSGAAGGDLAGTYPNPEVSSVANVTTGILPVANGGTGVATVSGVNQFFANTTSGSAPAFRTIVPGDLPIATTTTLGAVQADGTTIEISPGGVITAIGAAPSGVAGGDLSGTFPNPSVVSVANVTTGTLGVANGGTGVDTVLGVNQFFANTTGGSAPAFRSIVPGDLPIATTTALGAVQADGTTIEISPGGVITAIGAAPSGVAGGDLSGTFPNPSVVSVADVTTGTLGVANGGTGVDTVLGVNQFFANTTNGSAPAFRSIVPGDLPIATTTALGAVQADGTTIEISPGGVITAIGAAPSGVVTGGDLTGTYPNPTIDTAAGADIIAALTKNGGTITNNTSGNASTVTTNANLTGPVTSVGNATTITDGAVTYGKIQNESNNTLLGNTSGGSASPEELTLGSGITVTGTTLSVTWCAAVSGTAGGDLTGHIESEPDDRNDGGRRTSLPR